jgi:hypothetical protein
MRRASVRCPAVRDLRAREAGDGAEKRGGMGAAPVGHFGKKKCQGRSERLSIGEAPALRHLCDSSLSAVT